MEVANHSTTDEVVCLLTGMAPTTDNVASTRGDMRFRLMSSMGFGAADGVCATRYAKGRCEPALFS